MADIFQAVFITSLYASIVGLVVILCKGLLKNKINPKWHYIIWVVLILKLIFPFGPKSAVSLFNTIPAVPQSTAFTQYNEVNSTPVVYREQNDYNQPITHEVKAVPLSKSAYIENIVSYIWLLGVLLMFTWLIYINLSLHSKLKKQGIYAPEAVRNILIECKRKMGIKTDIKIVIQDVIGAPALFGVLQPKILLSPEYLNLSEKEISYILMHELAHYQRKDLLANHLLLILQVIHWFNPIIWYCFQRIRQDMEAAADERVITVLKGGEAKEYGKALLSVLEKYKSSRLAPKLIGMVDDKKNIERRIRMIKMADFFRDKRRTAVIIGIVCIIALSMVLLTSGLSEDTTHETDIEKYNAEKLLQFKSAYVGDNSKVVNLVSSLPYGQLHSKVSLQTKARPYGVTIEYDFSGSGVDISEVLVRLKENAIIMLALIDNADFVTYKLKMDGKNYNYQYPRAALQQSFSKDLREYAKDNKTFQTFLNSFALKLSVSPQKYSLAMSSTPGMKISAQYNGEADKIQYETTKGEFLTWDASTGSIKKYGQKVQLSIDTPAYWSPLHNNSFSEVDEILIKVTVLNKNITLAEKQVTIRYDGTMYFNVYPLSQNPTTIDDAVSLAIKEQGQGYHEGEVFTEGHNILEVVEEDGIVTAYTVSSCGWFGFENGIFTKISGSGAIPTVIKFSKNERGEYSLLEYKEPLDGAGYMDSIKKMFPKSMWDDVLKGDKYADLVKQQKEQAELYLQSIGRKAQVSGSHVKKKLVEIDVQASNKLFSEFTKYDAELNKFPYWQGTRELMENGVRYIYKTSQSKTSDGFDLIIFNKTKEDGTLVKEYRYKIVGSEPQLID